MLELATGLVGLDVQTPHQVSITLEGKSAATRLVLNSVSTIDSIASVVDGRADVGIVNPSAALMQAFRGIGGFNSERPVRTLAVLPSQDSLIFAVHADVVGETLDDIAATGRPLRVSVRANSTHGIHAILNHILSSIDRDYHKIRASGGEVLFDGASPGAASTNLERLTNRKIDAIFDEGADEWLEAALAIGARVVGFREETVATLERLGYRRSWLRRDQYPSLARDVLTIDFSGWPVFVRADLADEVVLRLCKSLELRIRHIPWNGSEPLDIAAVCRDADETPIMAPLHPAAVQYWRDQGYL